MLRSAFESPGKTVSCVNFHESYQPKDHTYIVFINRLCNGFFSPSGARNMFMLQRICMQLYLFG